MKLTNDFIWRPPSQLIDQQQHQRKADVKLLRPNSRTFKKRFYLSFDTRFNKNDHVSNQHSTLREQVQSIDQLFWANNEAKQRRLDANCRQQHQFPTITPTNVKMNLKRVEQINNRSKQNDKWQQNVKAKVVAPLQERNNNNNSTTSYDYGDNNNNNI